MADEKLTVKIEADIGDLSSDTKKARRDVETFADKSENALDDFERAMRDAKSTATTALAGIAGAFAGGVLAIGGLVESSTELRNETSRVVTAFESMGGSADTAMSTFEDLYAIMGDTGAASEAAQLLANVTTDSKELNEWLTIMEGSWATFGTSIPLESLAEAINEFQNTGEAVSSLADILNWTDWSGVDIAGAFGDDKEALEEFYTALEEGDDYATAYNRAMKYVEDPTRQMEILMNLLTGAVGDAAAAHEQNTKAIQDYEKAQFRWDQKVGEIAEILAPAMTALMEFGTAVLDDMKDPLTDASKWIVEKFIPALDTIYDWCNENGEFVISILTGVVTAFTVNKVSDAVLGITSLVAGAADLAIAAKTSKIYAKNMTDSFDDSGKAAKNTKFSMDDLATVLEILAAGAVLGSDGMDDIGSASKDADKKIKNARFSMDEIIEVLDLVATSALLGADGMDDVGDSSDKADKKTKSWKNTLALVATNIGKVTIPAALAAAGIALITQKVDEAWEPTQHLTEEQQKLVDTASALADEYGDFKTQIEDDEGVILGQKKTIEALATELYSLADANGYVQEKDRARAEYIAKEMKESYGIEVQMIDGQIQGYETLAESIQSVIDQKTIEALLEVNREAYTTALQNEAQAWDAVNTAKQAYEDQLAVVQTAEEEYQIAHQAVQDALAEADSEADYRAMAGLTQREQNAAATLALEKGYLDELGIALDGANADYAVYQADIVAYQEAMRLAEEGHYSEAIAMLTEEGQAWSDYTGDVEESMRANVAALEKNVVDTGIKAALIKEAYENGIEGFGEKELAEAQQAHEDALAELETAVVEATQAGIDVGYGFANGTNAEDVLASVRSKATSLVSNMLSAMRAAADSHSPSRKTMALGNDMGAGLELGIDDKAQDVAASASKMIQEAIVPIDTNIRSVSYTDFADSFGTSLGSLSYSNNRMAEALINTMVGRRNSNTPIVLEVDGKVFAQTSIDTINKLTRQTGSLGLQLV